ncbi:MAG: hypothetical protein LBF11_03300 [Paenibacillus polymyxa]|nr:hypothetical protein [Paenibacillus polymyxa]
MCTERVTGNRCSFCFCRRPSRRPKYLAKRRPYRGFSYKEGYNIETTFRRNYRRFTTGSIGVSQAKVSSGHIEV